MSEHQGARMDDALSKVKEWGADLQKRLIEAGKDEEFAVQNLMGEAACCLKLFESALSGVEQEPFGHFHELLDHEGKGNGVWLGCKDKEAVEQAYTEGETGNEIVTLYTSPIASGKDAWISIEDRLPEANVSVLLYCPKKSKWDVVWCVAKYRPAGEFNDQEWLIETPIEFTPQMGNPTHWTPLPPAPDAALAQKGGGNG